MIKKFAYISFLLLFVVSIADAQRTRRWKKFRYEIVYGIGATNFLGELGGADKVGTNFLNDFELTQTRPMIHLGARYKVLEVLSVKSAMSYGWISGNDNTTNDVFRSHRNLSFRSPIVEWSTQAEYSLIKEKIGHKYNLRRVRGLKNLKINIYIFAGIAGFWFNPKAEVNGAWVPLQPLGTEGQGKMPSRELYSRVSVSVPMGIGFKYGISRKWSIGIEYGYRKTFTDYIDDVSLTYVDASYFDNEVTSVLADPSVKPLDGSRDSWTAPGQQRGDSMDKDSYMFAIFSLAYKLRTGRNGFPKF